LVEVEVGAELDQGLLDLRVLLLQVLLLRLELSLFLLELLLLQLVGLLVLVHHPALLQKARRRRNRVSLNSDLGSGLFAHFVGY
jgi:hypothetical protein